jgi:cellulose synthase/poly-beta-1,6-N-acetylglucosamine synthase-like glycosyltransferase
LPIFNDALRLVYTLCLFGMCCYTAGTCILALTYVLNIRKKPNIPPLPDDQLPKVAVQLPLYNERYVARRLIDAVALLDYPRDRLVIQVLDDSTDDTAELIQGRVAALRAEGLQIELIHRTNRAGYKAGALQNGMTVTDADYFAIFDADFIPPADFLRRTMPHFQNDKIGMVQTRWAHLNADENWLTRGQSLGIDGHFMVEQHARYHGGLPFIFNGSGGVWRRAAIEDAGGWHGDTLCEDFDLSYRAIFKGWKFAYTRDIPVPGEIPSQMASYKQQQARWAKGSTQVMMKHFGNLWRSDLSLIGKLMGMMLMVQYVIQLFLLLMLLLTPLMILTDAYQGMVVLPYSLLALSAPLIYGLAQVALYGGNWWRRTLYFIPLLVFCSGLSYNNGRAVISALFRQQTEFKRTPKFQRGTEHADQWARLRYTGLFTVPDVSGEWFMGAYTLAGLILALWMNSEMAPYMLFYTFAFNAVVLWSLWDRRQVLRIQQQAPALNSEPIQTVGR